MKKNRSKYEECKDLIMDKNPIKGMEAPLITILDILNVENLIDDLMIHFYPKEKEVKFFIQDNFTLIIGKGRRVVFDHYDFIKKIDFQDIPTYLQIHLNEKIDSEMTLIKAYKKWRELVSWDKYISSIDEKIMIKSRLNTVRPYPFMLNLSDDVKVWDMGNPAVELKVSYSKKNKDEEE